MGQLPKVSCENLGDIVFNSSVKINRGATEKLAWNAAGAGFTAETPSGSWRLEIRPAGERTEVAFSGTLKAQADHCEVTLFSVDDFAADHVLPQNIRMGGCEAFDLLHQKEEEEFKGEVMLSLTKAGTTWQVSAPFHGGFPVYFQGTAHQGGIKNLRAVSAVEFYGSTEIALPVLSWRSGKDGFALMDAYAAENCDVKKTFAKPSCGWNSWDYYRWTITEQEVLENAEFIAKDPVLSKHVKRIIIDDGWQYCYGEWDANPYFPSGMEKLAKELTKMGFEPGLWFAPAIAEPHSRIAQWEDDMLAMSEGGQPCLAYECMRRYGFILDPTTSKTEKFLSDTFRRFVGYGYKYFKLDFLCSMFNAPRYHDATIKRDELIPRLLAPIFKVTEGKAAILGCNYPYTAGNRFVEAVRVGSDIHARWENVKHNVSAVASHFWANKKLWLNDPDFALCRSPETSTDPDIQRLNPLWVFIKPEDAYDDGRQNFRLATMKAPEVETLLSVSLAAGGAINLADKMKLLNDEGLRLARKVVSAESGEAARALDLFSARKPGVFLQRLAAGWRLILINWEDTPQTLSCDLAAQGVKFTKAQDFWREEPVALPAGRAEFTLQPHHCRVVELQ